MRNIFLSFVTKKTALPLLLLLIAFLYIFRFPSAKLPSKIDKIYVISLKESKTRRDRLEKKMKDANLEYEILDAVNGSELTLIDEFGKKFKGIDVSSGAYKLRIGETYRVLCPNITLTYKYDHADTGKIYPGSLGCYCSHVEAMLKVIKNKNNFAIILEDDADIPVNLRGQLDIITNSYIPKNWDIIYFGMITGEPILGRRIKHFRPILFNSNISKLLSAPLGLHAYGINYRSSERIISSLLSTNKQIDYVLLEAVAKGKLNAFFAKNTHVNQYGQESKNGSEDSTIALINAQKK